MKHLDVRRGRGRAMSQAADRSTHIEPDKLATAVQVRVYVNDIPLTCQRIVGSPSLSLSNILGKLLFDVTGDGRYPAGQVKGWVCRRGNRQPLLRTSVANIRYDALRDYLSQVSFFQGMSASINVGHMRYDISDISHSTATTAAALSSASLMFKDIDWQAHVSTAVSCAAHAIILLIAFISLPEAEGITVGSSALQKQYLPYRSLANKEPEPDLGIGSARAVDQSSGATTSIGIDELRSGKVGKATRKRHHFSIRRLRVSGENNLSTPRISTRTDAIDINHQVQMAGILGDTTAAPAVAAIFSSNQRAIGGDAQTALGYLTGVGLDAPEGVGGLSTTGANPNGGTQSGFIGAPKWNRIGKPGEGGLRNLPKGSAAASLSAKSHHTPRAVMLQPTVVGALDKSLIRGAIRRRYKQIKYCYEKELQHTDGIGGRVVISFIIGANGYVMTSGVDATSTGSSTVDQCIARVIKRIGFPAPSGGGVVKVRYPFLLKSAGVQ